MTPQSANELIGALEEYLEAFIESEFERREHGSISVQRYREAKAGLYEALVRGNRR